MKLQVGVVYEKLRIFGLRTPLGFRRKDVFRVGSELVFLDRENGEIRVLGSRDDSEILASCTLSRCPSLGKGFVGKIRTGEDSITLSLSNRKSYVIDISSETERWSFDVNPESGVSIRRKGFTLSANVSRYYWNPSRTNVVLIDCDRRRENLAKSLGVVVCSLLFDFLLDPASHV